MCLPLARTSLAADLTVNLPPGMICKSAAAVAPSSQPGEDGPATLGKRNADASISFTDLKPATPYDLRLVLSDGRVLHGVNMSWYTREPARPDAGPFNDDDRKQITALVADVKSFYDISRIVAVNGDHDRATILVERIRDSRFHDSTAGEVIWRIELWYFNNDFGGWAEPPQTNKIVLRTRFPTQSEYHAMVDKLSWVPLLGGIRFAKSDEKRVLTLPPEGIPAAMPTAIPATQPN